MSSGRAATGVEQVTTDVALLRIFFGGSGVSGDTGDRTLATEAGQGLAGGVGAGAVGLSAIDLPEHSTSMPRAATIARFSGSAQLTTAP